MEFLLVSYVWFAESRVPNIRNYASKFALTAHILGLMISSSVYYMVNNGYGKIKIEERVVEPLTEDEVV